jgi:hypothetical protein
MYLFERMEKRYNDLVEAHVGTKDEQQKRMLWKQQYQPMYR